MTVTNLKLLSEREERFVEGHRLYDWRRQTSPSLRRMCEVMAKVVRTLYVGNLPWATKPEELEEVFRAYGEVVGSRVITNRETGRSRGFGFIEVNDEDADKIIEAMNGAEFQGRILTVNEAKPKENE